MNIDINKSVQSGKLIYKKNWLAYLDIIAFVIMFLALFTTPFLFISEMDINNSNDKIIVFITVILLIPFSIYGIFRKLNENKLLKVETSFDKKKNNDLVIAFLLKNESKIYKKSKEVIISKQEEELSYNWLWSKTITFIITDGAIYFNMVKNYPKLNPPVMFSHLLMLSDLRKFVSNFN